MSMGDYEFKKKYRVARRDEISLLALGTRKEALVES